MCFGEGFWLLAVKLHMQNNNVTVKRGYFNPAGLLESKGKKMF